MNQLELNLEPTPKQLCCICKKDIAVMAFNKDWIHGCEAWTKDNQYSKDDRCCDPCNQKVLAKRLQDRWMEYQADGVKL